MQIEAYIACFRRNNVLMLFFEDFVSKPQHLLDTTFDFLEIDRITVNKSTLNTNKSFNRRVIHYKYDNPKNIFEKLKKVIFIIKNYFNSDFIYQKPALSLETKTYILNSIKDDIKKINQQRLITLVNLSFYI